MNYLCIGPLSAGVLIIVGYLNYFEYRTVLQKIAENGREAVIREIQQRNQEMAQYPFEVKVFAYIVSGLTSPARSIALGILLM
jgi:hypothetical protein